MPVPTLITDLSTTAASNFPQGTDSPSLLDDVQRAHGSFIAQLRNGIGTVVALASAATVDLGAQTVAGVEISGTTTITSFGTNYNGPRFLRFTGALVLTHNATTLNLPGGSNITTAPGDTAIAYPNQAANGWNVVSYQNINSSRTGISSVRNLVGTVNATTPLTKYDLTSADAVVLRDANNFTVVRNGVTAITCDLGLAGSAANGRDQAAAFTASSWVYLYYIWNGTTLATVASAAAPSTGPTLPTGYTHWAYAGSLRWNASSNIVPGWMRGSSFYYDLPSGGVNRVLSAGQSLTFVAVDCSGFVPPNALMINLNALVSAAGSQGVTEYILLRPTGGSSTGAAYANLTYALSVTTEATNETVQIPPGTAQKIDYSIATTPNSGGAYLDVLGFKVSNGDA